MSLLTVVQSAAEVTGFEPPSAVYGAADDNAKRFYRLAVFEAQYLLRRHPWAILIKSGTFTGAGTPTHPLPAAFHRMIPVTMWETSGKWPVNGAVTPQLWGIIENGWTVTTSLSRQMTMRIGGGTKRAYFNPALEVGENVVYDYVSKDIFDDGLGAQSSEWTSDDWTCLIDEHLITLGVVYRVLQSVGRDASVAYAEYREALKQAIAQDSPAERLKLGPNEFYLAAVTPDTIPVP